MTETHTTTSPAATPAGIVARAQVAANLLEAAELLGLPEPFQVSTYNYQDEITVSLHTLGDVAQWALWIEGTVEHRVSSEHHIHHEAFGVVDGLRVRAVAVEFQPAKSVES